MGEIVPRSQLTTQAMGGFGPVGAVAGARRVWLETYGCQMNKAESESLLLDLAREGWSPAGSEEEADLVILNTCSVRETAEQRIRGRLGHFRRAKRARPFTLVLTGCMAERLKGTLATEHPEIDVVVGTFQKKNLVQAVREAAGRRGTVLRAEEAEYDFAPLHSTGGPRAYVPIMHGCDNFCSYCIVPYVRGREVSRPPAEILDELRRLEDQGVREATLLGQNVNSYRWNGPGGTMGFDGLLARASAETGPSRAGQGRGLGWIRFLTSHPRDLSDRMLEVLASDRRFCRHVHLPIQSGSDRVLARMNRGYTAGQYLRLVEKIRAALTGAAVTTDILIGFPGESEGDFRDTLSLMETVGFDDAFLYYYNPREGTPAFDMEDALPDQLKLARLSEAIGAQRRIASRRAGARLGGTALVLVEGVSKKDPGELLGRTEWDAMAVFPGEPSLIGRFVEVRLRSLAGATFRADRT
jgi:tRNA-2-methylthio-N6-dimethylallyladenosine synthase